MKEKKNTQWLRFLAMVLAAALAFGLAADCSRSQVQAASSSELKEALDELKEEQAELEEQIQTLEGQIQDNLTQMEEMVAQKNALDQQIFLLREQSRNIQDQITAYSLLIADKQTKLDAARENLERLTRQNEDRIRTMEMYGQMSYWAVLAQASSFGEFLDRLSMVQEIASADQRRLAQMKAAAEQVASAQAALETEMAALEDAQRLLEDNRQAVEEKKHQADEVLLQLYATGQEYELWLEEKENEQNKLLEEIAQTEKEYNEAKDKENPPSHPGTKPPSSVTNGITWLIPINYWYFSSAYGWREHHPLTGDRRFHHGVDLAAPEGTPIYASRSGTVTAATRNDTNGFYVTINHGDGFSTTYLHMTHYTVYAGQYVQAGQKIGECGNTGASKGNHLHFGIYYNGSSVNPAEYINFY